MENIKWLKKISQLSAEQSELVREREKIQEFEENMAYQDKKDRLLYKEISYMFKEDRKMQRLCSCYQEVSDKTNRKRKRSLERYYESVRKKEHELQEEEHRIRMELIEQEEKEIVGQLHKANRAQHTDFIYE